MVARYDFFLIAWQYWSRIGTIITNFLLILAIITPKWIAL